MMARRVNVTDRALRYRAQQNVTGPKKCVICGGTRNLDVMHLDGNESHGDAANLAYGCRSCNGKLAAAFKRVGKGRPTNQYNPAKGEVPTFAQYAWAVTQGSREHYPNSTRHEPKVHDEAGAIIHATPKDLRVEYAQRMASNRRGRARARDMERWNPWPFSDTSTHYRRTASGGFAKEKALDWGKAADREQLKRDRADAGNRRFLEKQTRKEDRARAAADRAEDRKLRARDAKADALARKFEAAKARGAAKPPKNRLLDREVLKDLMRNPAATAADVFKEFHGHDSKELVTVKRKVHHHSNLAAAGELRGMSIKPVSKVLPVRHIGGLKDALLCFNEAKNQLFIEGGDQFMSPAELKKFGIPTPHELETLGKVTALDYFTNKTHLGDEGGEAVYAHQLRTTNEDGKHVVVAIARYPDLIYRVMDQRMEFSGGSYEIRAEGIDK